MASSGIPQIDTLVNTVANPNAPIGTRSTALRQLESLIQGGYRTQIATALKDNGMGINAQGNIVNTATGQSPVSISGDSRGGAPVGGTSWGDARQALDRRVQNNISLRQPQPTQTAEDNLFQLNPDDAYKNRSAYPSSEVPGGSGDPGFESGAPYDPANARVDSKYGNTFFGGMPEANLNELAGSPDMAWSMFRTRGGPGGGDLQNSTVGRYGEDNFKSAMFFQDLLGGAGQSNPDFLGSTDASMRSQMTPGGGYTDPAKLLNATFERLASEPDAATQEMMIDEALRQIEPYISPAQYQMMQSRIQRAMEQHLAYGLEAGTEDLNGVLLQSLQRAIGM